MKKMLCVLVLAALVGCAGKQVEPKKSVSLERPNAGPIYVKFVHYDEAALHSPGVWIVDRGVWIVDRTDPNKTEELSGLDENRLLPVVRIDGKDWVFIYSKDFNEDLAQPSRGQEVLTIPPLQADLPSNVK